MACENKDLADNLAKAYPGVESVYLNVADAQNSSLHQLIEKADVVVSILPANLHPRIAKCCIEMKRHMVTASYMSNEVREIFSFFLTPVFLEQHYQ